jgi:hypothetical protein
MITSRARYWRWERLATALALFNLLLALTRIRPHRTKQRDRDWRAVI